MRRSLARALLLGVPIGAVLLAAGAYLAVALTRRPPPLAFRAAQLPSKFPGGRLRMTWPAGGEAAVDVEGIGPLDPSGAQHPVPIASVAKIMTALVIVRDHPLSAGAQGAEIPITQTDVSTYRADRALGESVVRVTDGETLSERQALEALLLPSANNVATVLADWDAGSEAAFVAKMNARAQALGLTATRYADASGFDPGTVSTARDQARLAMLTLARPILAQIVAMPQARLPVAGLVHNLDALLGQDGIVGMKTGSTTAAGACFVFASRRLVGGRRVMVVGAVLGQPLTRDAPTVLDGAFAATTRLLRGLSHGLETLGLLAHRRPVGWITAPWGRRVAVRTAAPRAFVGWPGLPVEVRLRQVDHPRAPLQAGQEVGQLVIRAAEERLRLPLVVSSGLSTPSLEWRITHP